MSHGAVFYRGPSLLTGDPIVGIASGLEGESTNFKTGPMIQTYVLRSDQGPMDAIRSGADVAICGDCSLRGEGAYNRKCYVSGWLGPLQVYKRFIAGAYIEASWREIEALVEGQAIRLCAYGDPAAIPVEVWRRLLATASTWAGYTHQWRVADPRFKTIVMASVDSEDEFHAAHLGGWRTFRVRLRHESLLASNQSVLEFVCPASDEAGHTTTCDQCQLCRGTSSPARSVAIYPHGKISTLKAFGVDVSNRGFGRPAKDLYRSSTGSIKIQDPQPIRVPQLRAHDFGQAAGERLAKARP